jgi:hypothetical protein
MLEQTFILFPIWIGILSGLFTFILLVYFRRVLIAHINKYGNIFHRIIFVRYCNNIVDIDTGTEICTEVDDNEYKENIDNNILYANGIVDIESGTITYANDDEEFKDLNEQSIRYPISV